jgi:hypothetical protein
VSVSKAYLAAKNSWLSIRFTPPARAR